MYNTLKDTKTRMKKTNNVCTYNGATLSSLSDTRCARNIIYFLLTCIARAQKSVTSLNWYESDNFYIQFDLKDSSYISS